MAIAMLSGRMGAGRLNAALPRFRNGGDGVSCHGRNLSQLPPNCRRCQRCWRCRCGRNLSRPRRALTRYRFPNPRPKLLCQDWSWYRSCQPWLRLRPASMRCCRWYRRCYLLCPNLHSLGHGQHSPRRRRASMLNRCCPLRSHPSQAWCYYSRCQTCCRPHRPSNLFGRKRAAQGQLPQFQT